MYLSCQRGNLFIIVGVAYRTDWYCGVDDEASLKCTNSVVSSSMMNIARREGPSEEEEGVFVG